MGLSKSDVGCALSETYLQAVAHYAGYPCDFSGRLKDNSGVDATLSVNKDFGPDTLKDFVAHIQLKHCSKPKRLKGKKIISHDLEVKTFNRYRETNTSNLYLIILLVLGPNADQWLTWTPKQLCIRGTAYYTCVYGHPPAAGSTTTAIHYDMSKRLTPDSLETVLQTFAKGAVGEI